MVIIKFSIHKENITWVIDYNVIAIIFVITATINMVLTRIKNTNKKT